LVVQTAKSIQLQVDNHQCLAGRLPVGSHQVQLDIQLAVLVDTFPAGPTDIQLAVLVDTFPAGPTDIRPLWLVDMFQADWIHILLLLGQMDSPQAGLVDIQFPLQMDSQMAELPVVDIQLR
jgi:hypothetical protein